jgi:hypothetical protein
MSVFCAINALLDESDCCQNNSLSRTGFYAPSATSAIGDFYMGNGVDEINSPRRTDILTHLASGTPIEKNSGNQLRFATALFFAPNSFLQCLDLLFHDSNLLLQRLYSRGVILPSGGRCAERTRLLISTHASAPAHAASASGSLSSSHSATPCRDRNFHFLILLPVHRAIRLIHEDIPHFLSGYTEESAFLIGLCPGADMPKSSLPILL